MLLWIIYFIALVSIGYGTYRCFKEAWTLPDKNDRYDNNFPHPMT